MKNLFLLFCLCFSMTVVNAQKKKNITISVDVEENSGGNNDVTTTTSVDGKIVKVDPVGNVDDKDVDDVIDASVSKGLEAAKGSKGVKAGPNGEGDVVIGKMGGGDVPPIIFTTGGDDDRTPDFPEGSIIYKYKSVSDMQNNYRSDLRNALDQIMK